MIEALIGLAGVIIGSAIVVAKDLMTSAKQRRRDAHFSAIRIVSVLDEYFGKCVDVVRDDGTSHGRPAGRTSYGEEYHEAQVETPEPPTYPEDVIWKSLPGDLIYEVLSLSSSAADTNQYIRASHEHACPPKYEEVFEARQGGYATLGLAALGATRKLRRTYEIPEREFNKWNPSWCPEEALKTKLSEIEERESRRAVSFEPISASSMQTSEEAQ